MKMRSPTNKPAGSQDVKIAMLPQSHTSCFELARMLPDLWRQHDEIDAATLLLKGEGLKYFTAMRSLIAVANRIDAVEDLIMETPAETPADAAAQLLVTYAALSAEEKPAMDQAARAIMFSLLSIAESCQIDLEEIGFSIHAPYVTLPAKGSDLSAATGLRQGGAG